MTTPSELDAAIEAIAYTLGSARGDDAVDLLRTLLVAVARDPVGEQLVFCLHIDLARGRLTPIVMERLFGSMSSVSDLATLSAEFDRIADRFVHAAAAVVPDGQPHVYAAVWNIDRCHDTFIPPTRPKDLDRFRDFLEREQGARFSAPQFPVVSWDRPLGWVTAFRPIDLPDRQSTARIQLDDLIEELGIPWNAGKRSTCLVVFPAPLADHASLGVPTALSSRWHQEGMFVSNDRDEAWGQTRDRTRTIDRGRPERVHSEIRSGDLSPSFFIVGPVQDVTLQPFSQRLALESARVRSARL